MSLNLAVSDKQYTETVKEGNWREPTITTRKSSSHDSLVGICQLTDLFFRKVQECTTHPIHHTNDFTQSTTPFVRIGLDNVGDQEGWKEKATSSAGKYDKYAQSTKWVEIKVSPPLTQRVIQCTEAVLVEKFLRTGQDTPEWLGSSAYILDTVHDWTLTLTGIDHTQTFTLHTVEQEANI